MECWRVSSANMMCCTPPIHYCGMRNVCKSARWHIRNAYKWNAHMTTWLPLSKNICGRYAMHPHEGHSHVSYITYRSFYWVYINLEGKPDKLTDKHIFVCTSYVFMQMWNYLFGVYKTTSFVAPAMVFIVHSFILSNNVKAHLFLLFDTN